LSRELGVSCKTAWKLKHKLLQVMHERNQRETLALRIKIDDVHQGGERPEKRGRGADRKVPFVAAVETDDSGHPQRVQLRRVSGFTPAGVLRYAQTAIAPGSQVVSDGLSCFRAFESPAYTHELLITGGGRASAQIPAFNWVNMVLGNVKNAITGSYYAIRGPYAPRYLAEFEYRFNRR
jgi:hypothetical protein